MSVRHGFRKGAILGNDFSCGQREPPVVNSTLRSVLASLASRARSSPSNSPGRVMSVKAPWDAVTSCNRALAQKICGFVPFGTDHGVLTLLGSGQRLSIGKGQRRILVVDDEVAICEVIAAYLAGRGFLVTCATSAQAARAELSRQRFDLVILDVLMHGKSGLELARIAAGCEVPHSRDDGAPSGRQRP